MVFKLDKKIDAEVPWMAKCSVMNLSVAKPFNFSISLSTNSLSISLSRPLSPSLSYTLKIKMMTRFVVFN